jgi:type IV pilus assembly protein PilW
MKQPFARCRQSGLTLVELLVASLIGFIIIAVFGQVFLSGRQSYRTQSGMGSLQENGRIAMYFLQQQLRMAGFPRQPGPGVPAMSAAPLVATNGASGAPDTIRAQHLTAATYVDASGIAVPDPGTDCLGQDLPVGQTLVYSQFTILNGTLRCEGSGNAGSPQPIVGDDSNRPIEDMQILYGEDTDGDSYANVYRRADQVATMANVVSMRVGLRINSGEPLGSAADTGYYALLDATPVQPTDNGATPNDERLFGRRVFTTTIQIRNLTPE